MQSNIIKCTVRVPVILQRLFLKAKLQDCNVNDLGNSHTALVYDKIPEDAMDIGIFNFSTDRKMLTFEHLYIYKKKKNFAHSLNFVFLCEFIQQYWWLNQCKLVEGSAG